MLAMTRLLQAFFILAATGCAASRPAADPAAARLSIPRVAPPIRAALVPPTDFTLTTVIDLTAHGLMPQPLAALADFAQAFAASPGHAVVQAAAAAKLPVLSTLVAKLPRSFEKRLAALFDRAMADNNSAAIVQSEAAAIAELAAQVLGTIELESQLNSVAGRHTAARVAAVVRGERVAVPVAVFEKIGGSSAVQVTVNNSVVQVGEHRLGIRLGSTLWSLVEAASVKQTGFTPAQRISRALACVDVATRVAATCIAKVCVGHAAALQEVCEAGGQAAIVKVQAQFATLDYDAFAFRRGEATLDGINATQVHGAWELQLDVGTGPHQARATFTGVGQATTP